MHYFEVEDLEVGLVHDKYCRFLQLGGHNSYREYICDVGRHINEHGYEGVNSNDLADGHKYEVTLSFESGKPKLKVGPAL